MVIISLYNASVYLHTYGYARSRKWFVCTCIAQNALGLQQCYLVVYETWKPTITNVNVLDFYLKWR